MSNIGSDKWQVSTYTYSHKGWSSPLSSLTLQVSVVASPDILVLCPLSTLCYFHLFSHWALGFWYPFVHFLVFVSLAMTLKTLHYSNSHTNLYVSDWQSCHLWIRRQLVRPKAKSCCQKNLADLHPAIRWWMFQAAGTLTVITYIYIYIPILNTRTI